MSMGNYLSLGWLVGVTMATNNRDTSLERSAVPPDPEPDPIPGIAHLTVVPTNAADSV